MSEDVQKNSTQEKINHFEKKNRTLKQMGGEKQIARQHELKN